MQMFQQFPIRSWWEEIAQLLFPPMCIHCERVGTFLCPICYKEAITPAPRQPRTDIEGVEGVIAAAIHDGAVRSAVHALKYEGVREAALPLGELMAEALRLQQWTFDLIIPIPLHFARLAERGYNQANLLAEALAPHMNCPVRADALIRTKATSSQVTLGAKERQENLADAFSANPPLPQRVLLIDDVCTTGSTLGAAAVALRRAGVETVYAVTAALAQ